LAEFQILVQQTQDLEPRLFLNFFSWIFSRLFNGLRSCYRRTRAADVGGASLGWP
jgi:hypothetical protein